MSEYPKMMYRADAVASLTVKRGFPGDQLGDAALVVKSADEESAAVADGYGVDPPKVAPSE